jgi:hypothetical protein
VSHTDRAAEDDGLPPIVCWFCGTAFVDPERECPARDEGTAVGRGLLARARPAGDAGPVALVGEVDPRADAVAGDDRPGQPGEHPDGVRVVRLVDQRVEASPNSVV